MLAQNPSVEERALIKESFAACHRHSITTNLAAWITAYIEIEGVRSIDELDSLYLANADRSDDEISAVVTALSVHAKHGNQSLRDRVSQSFALMIRHHPEQTQLVDRHVRLWQNLNSQ